MAAASATTAVFGVASGVSAVASCGTSSTGCLRSGASWLLGLWVEAIVMCIDLPSSSGVRSATPWSLTRSTNFIEDIGADSLDIVELVMELEEEFDIQIPDDQAEKIKTVGEAIDYIEAQVKDHQAGEGGAAK